jgi:hypothetical protein
LAALVNVDVLSETASALEVAVKLIAKVEKARERDSRAFDLCPAEATKRS